LWPKAKKSLDNSLDTSLEEMDSETTVKEQVSHQGFLYKDTRSGEIILVDGILGSMFMLLIELLLKPVFWIHLVESSPWNR